MQERNVCGLHAGLDGRVRVERLVWGEAVRHVGRRNFDLVIACGARTSNPHKLVHVCT